MNISGRFILKKESWKKVFVKGSLFSNNLCFFTFILIAFIENVKSIEKSTFL